MNSPFKPLLAGTAIVILSLIAPPAFSTPVEKPVPNRSIAALTIAVTPFCPNNQPSSFPKDKCSTSETINLDPGTLNEVEKRINDRFQQFRRSVESDKILVPLIEIKF